MSEITRSKKDFRKPLINEIIIVEGKTDTVKLKSIFNCETIETNGSEISLEKINLIKQASLTKGVILFLDPDYQGKKIRDRLIKELTVFKEVFIDIKDLKHSKKKGVAEADNQLILEAFKNLISVDKNNETQTLSWEDYLSLNLNTKKLRLELCEKLKIPYCNNKSLYRYLNLFKMDLLLIKKLISET
ncbi:ribonuclease M5 [Mycoplasma sp. E35C]|uniref:ribonuclease M5 n=1 Tax=Mycoplasma sp. E35C TaxID=2801918 RepID=UPI001CA3FF2E|nr:ribonuclease M5 [Mycoplasma sp. E35C]QZX49010.1 ribonuclease M5 [Mycoplasma sp. E35C]